MFLNRLKAAHDSTRPQHAWADGLPTLPGYEVLEEIGRGGMGVVYRAKQQALERVVALKVMLGGSRATAEHFDRFRAEALAVGRLRHPGIVQVHEVGEWKPADGGAPLPYFCLEYVEGGSLEKVIRHAPQLPHVAAELTEQLARAMDVAHREGLIHRDLKPANVLLSPTGVPGDSLAAYRPKIADFGLVKQIEVGAGHTQTGMILGTPSYMAPEQARGDTRAVGPLVDVYALGAILYELLTGRPPFHGATPLDTLRQVTDRDPVSPRHLQPTVPRDLETICLKCLEKEPRKRYHSAVSLADDLARYLAHKPIMARPVGPIERLVKWSRRNPAVAALSGALAVVIVGSLIGLSVLYLRSEAARERSDTDRQAALNEQAVAVAERQKAQKAQLGSKAMNEFLVRQVFTTPLPTDKGGLGKDTTVVQMLRAAAPKIDGAFPGQPENEALVHSSFGEMFIAYGDYPSGKKHFIRGLELLCNALPPNDERLLDAKHQLGKVLFARSEFEESYPLLDESYRGYSDRYGPKHEKTLEAQIHTADALRLMLRYIEAETLVREALTAALTVRDSRSEQVLAIKFSLADCLGGQGKAEEAEQMYKEVLDGYVLNPAFGPDHPQAIVARSRYGFRLLTNEKYDLAEATLKTALEGYRRVFTLDHPSAYTIRGALGDICHKRGMYQEAIDHFTEVLAAYRKSQDAKSPLMPFTQGRLGRSLAALGKFKEGEQELLAAQKAYSESKVIPPRRRYEMVSYIVELYEKWDKNDEAAKWRAELEKMPK